MFEISDLRKREFLHLSISSTLPLSNAYKWAFVLVGYCPSGILSLWAIVLVGLIMSYTLPQSQSLSFTSAKIQYSWSIQGIRVEQNIYNLTNREGQLIKSKNNTCINICRDLVTTDFWNTVINDTCVMPYRIIQRYFLHLMKLS